MWKNSLFNPSQPPEMSEGYIPTAVGEGGTMPAWPMRVACEPLSRDFGFRVERGELEKVGGRGVRGSGNEFLGLGEGFWKNGLEISRSQMHLLHGFLAVHCYTLFYGFRIVWGDLVRK